MGWLFHNDKLRHQSPAEYFTRHFTRDSESSSSTVIATATVRGTVYAAVRNLNKKTGVGYIFCAVILFKNSDKDGFGYKDMDESVGPCEVDCPDRIMRLLSPVGEMPSSGYATTWRERVAAAKAKREALRKGPSKLSPDDMITPPYQVTVGHPSSLCRLRPTILADATVTR